MVSKNGMFVAVSAALAFTGVAFGADANDAKIKELEAKVAALESRQANNNKEVAATIDSVLRDAERRSQLLATMGDAGAGYDNGFFIRQGDFLLRPGALFQFRNVTDYRESARQNADGDDDDRMENGFEIARMQLSLEGTAFSQNLEYNFTWESLPNGGSLQLLDAWVKYMFADDWGFRVGQFKDPTGHEFLVSDSRLLAVDRSLMDAVIGGGIEGRTQGATLIYGGYNKNNPLNVEVGLTDGAGEINTDYTKHNWDFGVAGRAEYKAMGNWTDYKDFTAMNNREDLLVFGVGGDWSQNGDGNRITGTADVQWENSMGLGVYGALRVVNTDDKLAGGDDDFTDWGGLVQASYMLNKSWELFGRWDFIDFDGDVKGEDFYNEFTLGVNYYLGNNGSAGHRAKVTVDVSYLPDGAPGSFRQLGYLGDSGDGDAEIVVRGQFQLWL